MTHLINQKNCRGCPGYQREECLIVKNLGEVNPPENCPVLHDLYNHTHKRFFDKIMAYMRVTRGLV